MAEEGQVTGIGAWRERNEVGELVTLPSGMVVRRRRVHILDLVGQGGIPAGLAKLASEMVSATRTTLNAGGMKRYIEIVHLVVKASLIEPQVGDEATEEQLAVGELEMLDKLAIFNDGNATTRRLRAFRPEKAKPVGTA
jgi:hypothetical protein